MMILKQILQRASNTDRKSAFLRIMLLDLVPKHGRTTEHLQD